MKVRLRLALILALCATHFVARCNVGDSTVKVLILPPYDQIANAGVSPDTRTILESSLSNKAQLSVIPFPFRTLMGVQYQMVYDKKYCEPIIDKVDCDVIIMTHLITDNERKPGTWPWHYKIRVYNTRTKQQLNSISGNNLKAEDIASDISSKIDRLIKDIGSTFTIK
ncbi:MAG TPA: hypothetical protein VGD65_07565 [Chryseosolibacter sp.]